MYIVSEKRPWGVALLPLEALRPHENINEEHLRSLMSEIVKDGVLRKPILVDFKTLVILDGHHRVEALRRLGARVIPAFLVDYSSDRIVVSTWRKGWRVTKKDVLRAGLTGAKMPFKTSRHILVGVDLPIVNIPLEKLGVRTLEAGRSRRS